MGARGNVHAEPDGGSHQPVEAFLETLQIPFAFGQAVDVEVPGRGEDEVGESYVRRSDRLDVLEQALGRIILELDLVRKAPGPRRTD